LREQLNQPSQMTKISTQYIPEFMQNPNSRSEKKNLSAKSRLPNVWESKLRSVKLENDKKHLNQRNKTSLSWRKQCKTRTS